MSYFDTDGHAYKPILLPQKDPAFYDTFLNTYNVPELVTGKVKISPRELTKLAYDKKNALTAKLDPEIIPRKEIPAPSIPWRSVPNKK